MGIQRFGIEQSRAAAPRAWLALLLSMCLVPHAGAEDRVLRMTSPAVPSAAREPRIALVIGNGHYKQSPLANPVNDARAVARALADSGFAVTQKEDLGQREMQIALREFGDALMHGGVGLFYFAGHGVQVKGRNYLIPVDADIEREDEVAYSGVDANQVLDKMESANNRLNIVILDACRNNPFARSYRSSAAGLAQMDAPVGTLVAFSTAPGSVASDGQGENGLYTQHLLKAMREPGAKIEDVFKRVRANVRRDSKGKQIPWESTSLEGDFIFIPKPPVPASRASAPPAKPVQISEIRAPHLAIGDTWTHQVIDLLSGSVKNRYTVTLTSETAKEWRFGSYVSDKAWNLLHRDGQAETWERWTPKRPLYDFPLQPGKTWTVSAEKDSATYRVQLSFAFKVIRQERVIVPAGIFDTLRIEGTSKGQSTRKKDGASGEITGTHRYWFSPAAGRFVAYEYEETNWKGVVHKKERDELVSYRRASAK
jgi:caspase domain-containing protein